MFYDIEEIIGHRLLPNGKHEYLVKWKVKLFFIFANYTFLRLFIFHLNIKNAT